MKDLALEFRDVTKTFEGSPPVTAVDAITIAIPRGSFSAIIGPSGSGKTTFLNLASGLDRPTAGEVRIGGKLISGLARAELCRFRSRHVGFVFQAYNLFPALTALENVEFTLKIRGDSKEVARREAVRALESVGLGDKLGSLPAKLSGGQQQRVAVARALATGPDILFADEPTANLDSKTASDLIGLFERLNSESGVTFLFSTHDRNLIDRVRTRIEIKDGRILSVS
jgi:putative ABC transport system ATP-binding protein